MAMTKAQIRASEKYRKANIKSYIIKFNRKHEADIIEWLDGIPGSKNDYVRKLIIDDMKKNND